MARTERESEKRRRDMAYLLVLPRPAESCRMAQVSMMKLEHTEPAEKESVVSVPQREQLARAPEPPLSKGKGTEPSVQIVRWKTVKVSESHTLAKKREREHDE